MTNDLLDKVNEVSSCLATLALQVRQEALAGLGSRNKIAEQVLLPILRRVYQSPGLSNANALTANFPGVDLYDPVSGLGVQVTSESAAKKISDTIEMLAGGTLPLTRLVIAQVTETAPAYQRRTRLQWMKATKARFAFDPDSDILPFERLLSRILLLPPLDIAEIAGELRALVRGAHAIHLLPYLRQQVERQLSEEQRIARYIPDVFVETQDAKYQARCFSNPALFARRIAGWFDRDPLVGLNRLAVTSGVPPVSTPSVAALRLADSPASAASAAQPLLSALESLDVTLAAYSELTRKGGEGIPRDPARAYVLSQTRYYIELQAGGMQYRISDRRSELECLTARLFLVTGPAGQGKTNFLCDFTERFLLRHHIPCAFLTARQLSRAPQQNLTEVLRQLIFPPEVTNFDEALATLAAACAERRQPFVLVVDGLNEAADGRTFAGQLEHLLESLVRSPHVRVLMTCRSEFLEQRFGSLLSGSLAPFLHISRSLGQRFDDEQYRDLLVRYFRFFRVRPSRVAKSVIELLQRDVLLLRFFCEAYGARDRGAAYDQPFVSGVYRDEIFRRYVEDKLGRAQRAIGSDRILARPLASQDGIRRVLASVCAHMLQTGRFADVPRDSVPSELDPELTVLLDEGLVLRHDLGPSQSLLTEPSEVINFTFDEMRDFLLAQYLLALWERDPNAFESLVAAQRPAETQSVEGLQRFLFYASRIPTNAGFLARFRSHKWYGAVYDTEIFDVPPTHCNADDRGAAEEALAAGGARAQHFARRLARCWEPSIWPVLNLDVLLEFAQHAAPAFFADVFAPAFRRRFYNDSSLGESFCRFIEREVLPKFDPAALHPYGSLFRLLILLLPVDATPTLDSPAVVVFRRLAFLHPAYAIGLLREAVEQGGRWPRAFLWRMLGEAAQTIDDDAALVATAQADVVDPFTSAELRRQAEWFLSNIASARSRT